MLSLLKDFSFWKILPGERPVPLPPLSQLFFSVGVLFIYFSSFLILWCQFKSLYKCPRIQYKVGFFYFFLKEMYFLRHHDWRTYIIFFFPSSIYLPHSCFFCFFPKNINVWFFSSVCTETPWSGSNPQGFRYTSQSRQGLETECLRRCLQVQLITTRAKH